MLDFILFDVGANWGTDSLRKTAENFHYRTWAFEPTPELHQHLLKESLTFSSRYRVEKLALSNYDGQAEFKVAAHQDWGTSSLLEFNDNLAETWPGRRDFYVDRTIPVEVCRFDTWFEATRPPIQHIDFFHCDTQGSDLNVLRGMGDYFGMIREGVVEVPQSEKVKLYREQHSREEVLDFLSQRGYEVYRVESQQNEDNLFFRPCFPA
jgi:FkbM family methyltransferase